MAACQNCGVEFDGRPWKYAANGRVHVDCTPPPPPGRPNRTGTMTDAQIRYAHWLLARIPPDPALERRVRDRLKHADRAEGGRLLDRLEKELWQSRRSRRNRVLQNPPRR